MKIHVEVEMSESDDGTILSFRCGYTVIVIFRNGYYVATGPDHEIVGVAKQARAAVLDYVQQDAGQT